jgi:hypothetical protein
MFSRAHFFLLSLLIAPAYAQEESGKPELAAEVSKIFEQSCVACHSEKQASGKLRLDTPAGIAQGGSSGASIVPQKSGESLLFQRISATDRRLRMPLAGAPLPADKIEVIKRWIDQGAPGLPSIAMKSPEHVTATDHWAYRKPVRPTLPAVKVKGKALNPIDNFILEKLEKKGLSFSPRASKEKLIRRASLDLTGLPPSPSEIEEFVKDSRPDAYERLVDRLLASPHYGERWARPWLDYARYADTNGYEADFRRTMWKYRDWVINALNRDMPFDEFTIEQIAGDMLPNPTVDQKIATGFHRNTMFNEEGGVDKDESYFEVLVDRVNTTGTVWLGSTIGCSQCHNHKYDPFTQKEYYQLMAFFSNVSKEVVPNGGSSQKYKEPVLELPTEEQERKRASLKSRIDELKSLLKTSTPELEKEQTVWEHRVMAAAADWQTLEAEKMEAKGGTTFTRADDGSYVAGGKNPRSETYILEAPLERKRVTGVRLEALPHPDLPRRGPGRDAYGNFILTELRVELLGAGGWKTATIERSVIDDGKLNDKRAKQLWSIDASKETEERLPRQLVSVLGTDGGEVSRIRVSLRQDSELIGQSIGRFRLSVTSADDPSWIAKVSAKLRGVLEKPADARTSEENEKLAEYYRSIAPSLEKQREELEALEEELEELEITTALIMEETPGVERPSDFVRTRGAFSAKADKVYAAVPAVLGSIPDGEPKNRLGLARWLVSRDNPLTARVFVNRVWEQYFGRGLVETSEDFGTQGARPTHPELLDWLAVEFMENGWSMKALHRLIVTSEAYRQTSRVTPELLEIDAENSLISRGPRFRMEAEMIRDLALAASGLLSEKIGGPSVFPPQPPGVWDLPYNDDKWEVSKGEDRYRRGLYTFIRRSATYPAMMNFDATSREYCTIRRIRTSTPLQALTTLNDEAFFEAAQALGRRLVKQGGATERERITYGFRLCTAREAKPQEIKRMAKWLDSERQYFEKHAPEAETLAPESSNAAEQAAWTMLGNVLLNMDETLTKD